MKAKLFKKYYSFTALCVINLVIYSLIFLIFNGILSYLTSSRLLYAFPIMGDVLNYQESLLQDNYELIPVSRWNDSSIIVFDEDGELLYASNQEIVQQIQSSDLAYIPTYNSPYSYTVLHFQDSEGEGRYLINQETYDFSNKDERIQAYCLLNENYEIVAGDLFSDKEKLGARELRLLQGFYQEHMNVEQYQFANANGEKRQLVLMTPEFNDARYTQVLNENRQIRLTLAPLFLAVVAFQIYFFWRQIKKFFHPLQRAIGRYRQTSQFVIDEKNLPLELRDTVTELERAVDALNQAKLEKEKMDKDRQRIITSLSHDLKTPLTVIQGFSGALLDHQIEEDKARQYLSTIHSRAVVANELINTLFDYNRLEHPEYQVHFEKIDLAEWTRQFLSEKYSEITDHGFELELSIPETPQFVLIDTHMMHRVMENLIGNSLKYNPPKTTIYISIWQQDEQIHLSVADNGIGVEPELLNTLFDPFTIGEKARSNGQGTGLGLSIVKKMVELQHGYIEVSNVRYALEFCIHFPIARDI